MTELSKTYPGVNESGPGANESGARGFVTSVNYACACVHTLIA